MLEPVYALIPAVIWSVSPIYYRVFMKRFDFLTLNLLRTSLASAALAVPAIYFGFGGGFSYALGSGVITLTIGDTLFLLGIREMGASVAAPVVYTYVLLIQLTAPSLGEVVPYSNLVAALMVIAGVYVLSRGGGGQPRAKGIAFALGASVAWTAGQDLIRVATNAGGSVVAVTFDRNFAAALGLGVAVLATGRFRHWPKSVTPRELGFVAFIALTDLVIGSLLYVYSVSLIGIALTAILTSLSPLLTQVFSKALGKEAPSNRDYAGGVLIVAALVLALAL
ncbi:MAG: DMT family transporter [Nitrososphaerales archaeon]|nr:DMT family transporter [Nitrososphaerales archaeon]